MRPQRDAAVRVAEFQIVHDQTRLLGALPMLTVSLFLTAALIGVLLV